MTTTRSLMAAVLGAGLALAALPGAADAATRRCRRRHPRPCAPPRPPRRRHPAGKLSPSGCQRAGTEVACDLWAKPGTAQILGQPLPIWGFAAQQADPATAPGPVLVVQQGDHVTVTLHNEPDPADVAGAARPAGLRVRRRPRQRPAGSRPAATRRTRSPRPGPAPSSTRPATRPTAPARSRWGSPARSSCSPRTRPAPTAPRRRRTTTRRCWCSATWTRGSTSRRRRSTCAASGPATG